MRITAPLALHQAALEQCAALTKDGAVPARRKAYRTYADRITTARVTAAALAATGVKAPGNSI